MLFFVIYSYCTAPMQNNLDEYFHMIDFIRPSYFGSISDFRNQFAIPIANGQCRDSTVSDVKLMQRRVHVLQNKVKGFIHRIDYKHTQTSKNDKTNVVLPDTSDQEMIVDKLMHGHTQKLPPKSDYVLFISLSAIQKLLYKAFINQSNSSYNQRKLFQSYHMLMKIINHPDAIYFAHKQAVIAAQDKSFVGDNDDDDETNNKSVVTNYEFIKPIINDDTYIPYQVQHSGKILVTLHLIQLCLAKDDKIIIFSQNLNTLNILSILFQQLWRWRQDINWFRLDGSTNAQTRQHQIDIFNKHKSQQKVYLVSTKAGCLGVNMIGANHIVLMDVSWNVCKLSYLALHTAYHCMFTQQLIY